jgi:hypothetical protein
MMAVHAMPPVIGWKSWVYAGVSLASALLHKKARSPPMYETHLFLYRI